MSRPVKDSFLDLERHRQRLEENVESLRKSLRHWQMWEAEYEGFKEEILSANPTNDQQLQDIGDSYEGDLVSQKEIADILGPVSKRSPAQVINVLDRRLDYVNQNVSTIQKQLEVAERKLATATIISQPEVRNEEGLPLTDIIEELDDDGNIISCHTSTPGSSKPQLLEVLKKAGIKDIPEGRTDSVAEASPKVEVPAKDPQVLREVVDEEPQRPSSTQKVAKKAVKFAEDTKPGPNVEKSRTEKRVEEIMSLARRSQEVPSEPPIIPTNESPEDAMLRQNMLNYGLSEVGAVVAELDIEEGSDWSGDEFDEDVDTSDDEDAYGRSTGRVVDHELRERMRELEARLGARMMENIGKKADDYDITTEGIGRVSVNGKDQVSDAAKIHEEVDEADKVSEKKSVRFAKDIDISPSPQPAPSLQTKQAPVGDIVERTVPVEAKGDAPTRRASRFKQSRGSPTTSNVTNASRLDTLASTSPQIGPKATADESKNNVSLSENVRTVPTGPEGRTLASTIVERDVPIDTFPAEPDELDPNLLHQEVATEYHKARNRMIHRQGGFLKEEESEIVPFTEEEGGPKKMSRFKAARLTAGR